MGVLKSKRIALATVPQGLCEFPAAGPKRHLLMLGDSFVEGFQVSDADSMAGQLQQQLCSAGAVVHNLGGEQLLPGALRYSKKVNISRSIPRTRASAAGSSVRFL